MRGPRRLGRETGHRTHALPEGAPGHGATREREMHTVNPLPQTTAYRPGTRWSAAHATRVNGGAGLIDKSHGGTDFGRMLGRQDTGERQRGFTPCGGRSRPIEAVGAHGGCWAWWVRQPGDGRRRGRGVGGAGRRAVLPCDRDGGGAHGAVGVGGAARHGGRIVFPCSGSCGRWWSWTWWRCGAGPSRLSRGVHHANADQGVNEREVQAVLDAADGELSVAALGAGQCVAVKRVAAAPCPGRLKRWAASLSMVGRAWDEPRLSWAFGARRGCGRWGTSGQVVCAALDLTRERRPGRNAEGQLRPVRVLGVAHSDHGGEVRHLNAVAALMVAVAALTPMGDSHVVHSLSIAVLIAARDSSMESA